MLTTTLNATDIQLECSKWGKITENYASINLQRACIHAQPVALKLRALPTQSKEKEMISQWWRLCLSKPLNL